MPNTKLLSVADDIGLLAVAIQVLPNAVGGGRVIDFPKKTPYEDAQFNVISVISGWVSNFQKKCFT